jgi:hypothetical protein
MNKATIDQDRIAKIDSLPLTHFIKHFECDTKKSSQEHNEHQKNSSLLIQRLKNNTDFHLQEFVLKWKIDTALQAFHQTLGECKQRGRTKARTKDHQHRGKSIRTREKKS